MSNTFLDPVTGLATERVQLTGSKVAEGIADFVLNKEGTLLASAARTATASSPDQTNYNARGVMVLLNITVASGTGGLKVIINGRVNGNPVALTLTPTAITAVGKYAYEIYPGSTAAGVAGSFQVNQRTAAALPRTWYVDIAPVDATSYTYDVQYALIL